MPRKFKDITGQKFGRLTGVKFVERTNRRTLWEFKCDCGNVVIKRLDSVMDGSIYSCGCFFLETVGNNGRNSRFKKGHLTHNKGKQAKDYIDESKLYDVIKPVVQLTELGELVKIHQTMREAAKEVNRDPSGISKCANKHTTICGGFCFMFLDEYIDNRNKTIDNYKHGGR